MKKSALNVFLAAAALLLSSCSSDLIEGGNDNNDGKVSVSATQELLTEEGGKAFAPSRTTLAPNNDNAIDWTKGDAICIWDGTSMRKFTAINDGTTSTFTATEGINEGSTDFKAIYPYDMNNTFSGTTITKVTLPSNQVAVADGFDPACNLMTASFSDLKTTISFKHVCSYIKVTPDFDCSRIVFKFNDDAKVAGSFNVDVDNEGVPTVKDISDASNTITLLGDIQKGKAYYVAVLPNSYKGFTVTLEAKLTKDMVKWDTKTVNTSSYYRTTKNTLIVDRAKIKSIGTLTTDNTTQDANFTVPFEDFGLGDDINAEHGKKILWAKVNLGATTETETGEYYAWGETKPKNDYSWNTYLCQDYYPEVLDISHDAAAVNFGHGWRIPSEEDFVNLKENSIFVYTDNYNGATGFLIYPAGKTTDGKDVKNYQKMEDKNVYRYENGCQPNRTQITDPSITKYIAGLSPEKDKHLFIVFAGNKRGTGGHGTDAARYWLNNHGKGDLLCIEDKTPTAYYWGLDKAAFNTLSYYRPRYEGLSIRPCITLEW